MNDHPRPPAAVSWARVMVGGADIVPFARDFSCGIWYNVPTRE